MLLHKFYLWSEGMKGDLAPGSGQEQKPGPPGGRGQVQE